MSEHVQQRCPTCGAVYAAEDSRWRCETIGHEPLELTPGAGLQPDEVDTGTRSLWRYHRALRLPRGQAVSLGEGGTPMLPLRLEDARVSLKLDFLMPTGSFKDRGVALVVGHLRRSGAEGVVEDSSGNAGASFAAYAAAAGLPCTVYAPASTSREKLRQAELYGAALRLVEGSRDHVAEAARASLGEGVYAGHNWHPYFIEGCKTIAYEIWEDLGWRAPDAVIAPVGGGGSLLGLQTGFGELLRAGSVAAIPRLYGVQARNCSPLAKAFECGLDRAAVVPAIPTIAEGVALASPPRARQILNAIRESAGAVLAVEEREIVAALKQLLGLGIGVEPTSAVAFAGLARLVRERVISGSESVVVVLTGTALKAADRIHTLLSAEP